MKLINPTDKDISIQYRGDVYEIEANGSLEVSDEVATFWTSIHEFLVAEETKAPKASKTVKKETKESKETK